MKEKRLATILYADLTGFTQLTNELGAEMVTEFINECYKTIDSIIYKHDGTVVRHEGDRVMAAYGFPRSKGHDSYSAIVSALRIKEAINDFSHPVETHIGIATGEIICEDDKLFGYVTETASQLEEKAPAGEIFIDATCYELNKNIFDFEKVDGGPLAYFKLIGERTRQGEYPTKFIGREKEIELLSSLLRQGEKVIIVNGAQGIGKTRMIHETVKRMGKDTSALFYETSLLSTRTIHFYEAILDVIKKIDPHFSFNTDTELLSETAYNLKLHSQFCEVIFNASLDRTLILLFQYFERVDKNSLEFFKFLLNNIGTQDITCIFEMHKLHKNILKVLKSVARTTPHVIDLLPLKPKEQVAMIHDHCEEVQLPKHILDAITQHAEGNPLFITEVCNYVKSQCTAGKIPQRIAIPYRIKEVYNHLIDHIPVGIFNTLSVGAMYGYSVSKEFLKNISTNFEETIDYGIENGLWIANNGELTFRNPFFRDEICNRIPKSARKDIHRKIAAILRETSSGPENDKHLAYHFNECGDYSLALHYALKWAKILKDMHANEHALKAYDFAFEISKKVENQAEYRILHERCEVLHLLGRREEENEVINRLEEMVQDEQKEEIRLEVILCRGQYLHAISDFSGAVKLYEMYVKKNPDIIVLERLGMAYYSKNNLVKAVATLNRAMQLARASKDIRREAAIKGHLGLVLLKTGDKERSLEFTQQAIDYFNGINDQVSTARCRSTLALNYYYQSRYQEALQAYESALKVAREIGDVSFESKMVINSASIHTIMGDYEKALFMYEQALKTAQANMNRKWEAIVLNNIGNILATVGKHTESLRYFEKAYRINEEIDDQSGIAVRFGNIGDSYAHLGQADRALEYIQKAHDISMDLNIIDWISFYKNDLAQALLLNDLPDKALGEAQEALKLARKSKNISYVINALSTIAYIYYQTGEAKKALKYSKRAVSECERVKAIEGTICSVYFNHYQILTLLEKHDEAYVYLKKAYDDVKQRGDRITNEEFRQGFYTGRKENKEILEAWNKRNNQR